MAQVSLVFILDHGLPSVILLILVFKGIRPNLNKDVQWMIPSISFNASESKD